MPQCLHYSIVTILLLRNRAHQRIYIYITLPLFRRTLLSPTGAIPLTGLVCLDTYNVWLSIKKPSTVTGPPPARLLVRPSSRISYHIKISQIFLLLLLLLLHLLLLVHYLCSSSLPAHRTCPAPATPPPSSLPAHHTSISPTRREQVRER